MIAFFSFLQSAFSLTGLLDLWAGNSLVGRAKCQSEKIKEILKYAFAAYAKI